jgi:hypothetical protein
VELRAGLDDLEKRTLLTLPGLELRLPRSSSPSQICISFKNKTCLPKEKIGLGAHRVTTSGKSFQFLVDGENKKISCVYFANCVKKSWFVVCLVRMLFNCTDYVASLTRMQGLGRNACLASYSKGPAGFLLNLWCNL